MEQNQVAVRERTNGDIGVRTLDEFKEMAKRLVDSRSLVNIVESEV